VSFLFFDDEKVISIRLDQSKLLNRCINKLILGRVVPTISESSSWEICSSMYALWVRLAQVNERGFSRRRNKVRCEENRLSVR
jgi:hypothetical protein